MLSGAAKILRIPGGGAVRGLPAVTKHPTDLVLAGMLTVDHRFGYGSTAPEVTVPEWVPSRTPVYQRPIFVMSGPD